MCASTLTHTIFWLLGVFFVFVSYVTLWHGAEEKFSFQPSFPILSGCLSLLFVVAAMCIWPIISVMFGMLVYATGGMIWLSVLVGFFTMLASPVVVSIIAMIAYAMVLGFVRIYDKMKHEIQMINKCRKKKNKKE